MMCRAGSVRVEVVGAGDLCGLREGALVADLWAAPGSGFSSSAGMASAGPRHRGRLRVALVAAVVVVAVALVAGAGALAFRGLGRPAIADHGRDALGISVVDGVPNLGTPKPIGYMDSRGNVPVLRAVDCEYSHLEIARAPSATARGFLTILNEHVVAWTAVSNDIAATSMYYQRAVLLEARTAAAYAADLAALATSAPANVRPLLTGQVQLLRLQVTYLNGMAAEMSGGPLVDHNYGAELWNQRTERSVQIRVALGLGPTRCTFNKPV